MAVGDEGLSVIGNKAPLGFCGSGIVDAVAYLLNKGIINEKGIIKQQKFIDNLRFKSI